MNEENQPISPKKTILGKLILAILLIFLPLFGFILGFRYQQIKDSQTINVLMKQINDKSKEVVYVNQMDNSQIQQQEGVLEDYSSSKLGVSFSYFQFKNTKSPIKVREEADKIYVFTKEESDDITSEKFVQVFRKNTKQDFKEAIRINFLQNYSSDDCTLSKPALESKYAVYNPNNEYLRINLISPSEDHTELQKQLAKCPATYTYSWKDVGYFVMDKDHPDRYAFVNLGQSGFVAYPGLSWDMTLRFID